jgi:hypothetical protein
LREFPTTANHARPDAKTRNHRLLGPPAWRQGSGSGGGGRLAGIFAAAGIAEATGAISSCYTTLAPESLATCKNTASSPETLCFTETAVLADEAGSTGNVTPADFTGSTDIADATGLTLVAGKGMVAGVIVVAGAAAIPIAAATGTTKGFGASCNRADTGDVAGAESLALATDANAAACAVATGGAATGVDDCCTNTSCCARTASAAA